jgi:hypothetical protein
MAVQLVLKMKVKGEIRTMIKTLPIEDAGVALRRRDNWKKVYGSLAIIDAVQC